MKNLGWYFYRNYFTSDVISKIEDLARKFPADKKKYNEGVQKVFDEKNALILQMEWNAAERIAVDGAIKSISMETIYPGLFSGSGSAHSIGETGEFKLGFAFDHTSGQPYIPASSVKGTLRSAFPFRLLMLSSRIHQNKDADTKARLVEKARVLLKEYWGSKELKDIISVNPQELFQLEWIIFEGKIIKNIDEVWNDSLELINFSNIKTEFIPTYERDIFYDAFIADVKEYKGKTYFMGSDFITPHKHPNREKKHLDPFVNPTPIQFLKVLPNVSFGFNFDLKESSLGEGKKVSKEIKRNCFKRILLDFGIGAKTNVGYGQFKD